MVGLGVHWLRFWLKLTFSRMQLDTARLDGGTPCFGNTGFRFFFGFNFRLHRGLHFAFGHHFRFIAHTRFRFHFRLFFRRSRLLLRRQVRCYWRRASTSGAAVGAATTTIRAAIAGNASISITAGWTWNYNIETLTLNTNRAWRLWNGSYIKIAYFTK